jgi:hypothetical protein
VNVRESVQDFAENALGVTLQFPLPHNVHRFQHVLYVVNIVFLVNNATAETTETSYLLPRKSLEKHATAHLG